MIAKWLLNRAWKLNRIFSQRIEYFNVSWQWIRYHLLIMYNKHDQWKIIYFIYHSNKLTDRYFNFFIKSKSYNISLISIFVWLFYSNMMLSCDMLKMFLILNSNLTLNENLIAVSSDNELNFFLVNLITKIYSI